MKTTDYSVTERFLRYISYDTQSKEEEEPVSYTHLQDELRPIRERRKEIAKDIPAVYKILEEGSIKAEKKAAQTLAEMKRAMKINYFEDKELIAEQAARFSSEADA